MEPVPEEKELLIKGKKRALRLLERKDYSRKELVVRLQKDGYQENVIEQVIAYIDSYHYLDDIRVAASYINGKKEYKSKKELEFLLKQKGISEEDISRAIEENYINDDGIEQEKLAIIRQLRKYHLEESQLETMPYEEKQKVAAKLYRKGFASDKIRNILHL